MNYWLHRISHHAEVSYPLLKEGYLSTGWAYIPNPKDFIKDKNLFENEFKNYKPRSRFSLKRFVYGMNKGDYIVVPTSGKFSVYEIINEFVLAPDDLNVDNLKDWNNNKIILGNDKRLYKNDDSQKSNAIDLGFFRKVKPVAIGISRNKFADQKLVSRLKIRDTNALMNDLGKNIEEAITNFNNNKPIDLHSIIVDNHVKTTLKLIQDNLDDSKFEKLIKWYFEKAGANNVVIPAKNESDKEGDADIVATFESIKTIIYVQAKKHKGETSQWALNQINDYVTHKEESTDDGYSKLAWVVSTADTFSEICEEKAKLAGVQLINGLQFSQMLLEVGIGDLDSAFN